MGNGSLSQAEIDEIEMSVQQIHNPHPHTQTQGEREREKTLRSTWKPMMSPGLHRTNRAETEQKQNSQMLQRNITTVPTNRRRKAKQHERGSVVGGTHTYAELSSNRTDTTRHEEWPIEVN